MEVLIVVSVRVCIERLRMVSIEDMYEMTRIALKPR